MKILKLTSQFKKDLKRYKHKTEVINKLETILKFWRKDLLCPKKTGLIY